MSPTISSLARLTLRQLRQIASDLGVPLYSRKSKENLVDEVAVRQEKRGGDLKAIEAELNAPTMSTTETRVVFLPRDPQWAYVFWEISDSDRERAQKEGANRLCLRLADVTGMQDGSAHPHTLQEVPVDSHSTEWYLPVPLCDRDYRVELGYRISNSWMSLAFSSIARVPALIQASKFLINLCRSAWTHRLLPPLLPLLPHHRHRHQRTKPVTATSTSVCTKAPLFISVVVEWAQRNSKRRSTIPLLPVVLDSMIPVLACGRAAATSPASAVLLHVNARSGWWLMPS